MTPKSAATRIARFVNFKLRGRKGAFQHIYRKGYWVEAEGQSLSGSGSTLYQTEAVRRELPIIIEKFDIRSMIDAPCGDLTWMSHLLPSLDIDYIGGDIVPEAVEMARAKTDYRKATFREFDITVDPMPAVDLWLCRDVLFHLSYGDIRKALDNFVRSEVKYLLVTTHTGGRYPNKNYVTGDFRELDLFAEPFGFRKEDVLYRFEDCARPLPGPVRDMVLFAREDLIGRKLI